MRSEAPVRSERRFRRQPPLREPGPSHGCREAPLRRERPAVREREAGRPARLRELPRIRSGQSAEGCRDAVSGAGRLPLGRRRRERACLSLASTWVHWRGSGGTRGPPTRALVPSALVLGPRRAGRKGRMRRSSTCSHCISERETANFGTDISISNLRPWREMDPGGFRGGGTGFLNRVSEVRFLPGAPG
jgi:hypothetical protein